VADPGVDNGETLLTPVATRRVSDAIAEQLAALISGGRLKPGQQLPTEHALARDFGVGRTSVREGLQTLRALGIIEARKGLGTFVSEQDPADPHAQFERWASGRALAIGELIQARIALEPVAAALAAVRASDEQIAELAAQHAGHLAPGQDVQAVVDADQAFHTTIMAASANPFLIRCYEILVPEIMAFRRRTLALPLPDQSAHGHGAILDAIRQRDPGAARKAMLGHLYRFYDDHPEQGRPGDADRPLPREAFD